ncbi:type I-U CRISPR-associated protein Csb2 [Kineosporia sp. A_224]|uniref:type I-G CRISPR-associated protein Csb2 n=1 Tax=Kineosporia sp. A_224 TaxID=1962180 RepID=UPI000B4AF91B|nr:type I-U CRISPR-associated protein Csb2 [Kineosporia sp. A_224]
MTFTITAELPLGTYRGAAADGRVEAVPSVSRLYSALLSAAGLGPRAQSTGDALTVADSDAQALRWLEENPPDEVHIPPLTVNGGRVVAYRDDGTLKKSKASLATRKLGKTPDVSVAVAGRFTWTWTQQPPPAVAQTLTELCPDVPYLGTSESPVRLRASGAPGAGGEALPAATHRLDPDAGLFTPGGWDLELPVPGRLDELTASHRAATGTPPSVARDKYGTDEGSTSAVPTREAVALARYAPVSEVLADVPWPQVMLVPITPAQEPARGGIGERDRVRSAVAVHRALIRIIGDGAPPLVTGAYPKGLRPPTNRIAVHFLDASMPVDLPSGGDMWLALMIPAGARPSDLEVLAAAADGLTSFRTSATTGYTVSGPARTVSGAMLWRDRPTGTLRLWRTASPAIPDIRGLQGGWTFADTALLSLGFVVRDQLGRVPGRRDELYRNLVARVGDGHAVVLDASPVRTSRVQDYVHKVNDHAVIRPYRATVSLGDVVPDRCVLALGQSRHLGGGLLVPVDVPEGTALADVLHGTTQGGPR